MIGKEAVECVRIFEFSEFRSLGFQDFKTSMKQAVELRMKSVYHQVPNTLSSEGHVKIEF